MLDSDRIDRIAADVATANLTEGSVISAYSQPMLDSEGQDALRILILLKPGSASAQLGDNVLDVLVQTRDRLRQEGEDRFPIIEYSELSESW